MKISETSKEEATAALASCNNTGNIDFLGKRTNKDKEFPCDRWDYIDCVCMHNR